MDAFDRWWQWAEKPLDSYLTIPAEIHQAVMALPPEARRDRARVNAVVVSANQQKARDALAPRA